MERFGTTGLGTHFNPHSREGSDTTNEWLDKTPINFNPHSREGSDGAAVTGGSQAQGISIHTPAKGVTTEYKRTTSKQGISIHTPAKGVTKRA